MTRPADLTVTLRCNNRCPFCPRNTLRHVAAGDDLDRRLSRLRSHSQRVVLTGGEATVLPDIVEIVRRCRELGFEEVGIISNGRALARPGLAPQLVEAGLTEACVTVYDLRPDVHDAMTGVDGSLGETLEGLDRLLAFGPRKLPVRINTMLSARNADGLVRTLRGLAARGVGGFLVGAAVLSDEFDEPVAHAEVARLGRAVAADAVLRRSPVVWRGFPLCILQPLPGVACEPQDVDTASVPGDDLDAYFAEFAAHYVHVEACSECRERERCPGLQRRHLARFGEDGVGSQGRAPAGTERIGRVGAWRDPGRIAVTPTSACQMRCAYCKVELGRRHATPEVLDRAVDLLLTSERERLELQFFGGEPLLRRSEVFRSMDRARGLAESVGKRLGFTLTTNGLLLDDDTLQQLRRHDARVLFSFDGSPEAMARYRPLAGGGDAAQAVEDALVRLVRSGVPHFVNIVVTPDAAADLVRRLEYVAALGVRTVQLCYATGPGWDRAARATFCAALEDCVALAPRLARQGRPIRIQNLDSGAEPTVLSNDLLVDVDGVLYGDAALFAEKVFPGLREDYRVGHVDGLERFDGLRRSREENLQILTRRYPPGSPTGEVLRQLIELGLAVDATVRRLRGAGEERPPTRDRNPLLAAVLKRSVARQAELIRTRPEILKLPLLLLDNPCTLDCIFCKAKDLPPTPVADAEAWLAGNNDVGLSRLGLVGNEPLAHPHIDALIASARDHGFRRFEVLTTGQPLTDLARVRELAGQGVRGVALPLFSKDPAVHDAITRTPGSHRDTLTAIEHLCAAGADVHVHANLLRQNLDGAGALERFVREELGLPFCLIPVRPKDANLPYDRLVPRYAAMAERLQVSTLVAFPLCVAGQIQDPALASADLIADVLKVYVLDQPFIKPPPCAGCSLRARCAGTFQAYVDLFGTDELRPA